MSISMCECVCAKKGGGPGEWWGTLDDNVSLRWDGGRLVERWVGRSVGRSGVLDSAFTHHTKPVSNDCR